MSTELARSDDSAARSANVAGNARLTGSIGAVIFVLLFVEGITIVRVHALIGLHVFVGILLLVFALVKIATTGYRFARYYAGQREYVAKGPPPVVLRLLGPVVTIATLAVLATGIGAILDSGHTRDFALAHKITFVVWFGAMTVHVLGHAFETPALAFADWRRTRRREAPGARARIAVLGVAVAVGVPLAILSLGWARHWHHLHPG